jgi:inner membrane protein
MSTVKFPLFTKAVALFVVVILLMIGLQLIGNIAQERAGYREQAVHSIRQSLAGSQTIAGPIASRTCVETVETITETAKGKVTEKTEQTRVLKSLPQSLKWTVATAIEPRYRGLYKVNSYRIEANADVAWSSLEELATPLVKSPVLSVRCAEPKMEFAVSDPRGIRSIKLDWRDTSLTPQSMSSTEIFQAGFESKLPINDLSLKESQQMRIAMELVGLESLSFVPLANENLVEMTSDWPHPSFAGSFLPNERSKPNEKGFQAKWSVSSLASNARASLLNGDTACGQLPSDDASGVYAAPRAMQAAKANANTAKGCLQSFGVSFIDPVNPTTLADRATKYALLFIGLTFVGIVLLEVVKSVRVHAIQYLLIGAALAVFFLLLLSLSEHIGFAFAYAIAAAACVLLIGFYAKSVFGGGWARAMPAMAGLGVLYAVLYVVLQSEQHALLAGSLLIFAALAGVMLLTRRVNWNALASRTTAQSSNKLNASEAA